MSISNGDPQNDLENSIDEAFAAYLQLIDQADYTKIESFLAAHEQIAEQLQELIATASTVKSMANGSNEMLQRGATDSADHFATIAHNPTNSGSDSLQDQHSPDKKVQPGDKVQLVGEYELIEVLGRGGMGVVYKARQKSMNRFVALKMISSGGYPSEKSVRRFYQEARAAGKLSHPNIVRGFAAGEHDGRHFFAMELVEGRTLRNILKSAQQHLPANTIASYAKVLAEAVHYAHENGILHRDLKPSNIMIDTKDRPKIADFGLAKHVDPEGENNARFVIRIGSGHTELHVAGASFVF